MISMHATSKPFSIDKRLVYEAYKAVKSNRGAAGVDEQTIEQFDADLSGNLYRIWNRMSSGSYFPPPVRAVSIPKKSGGERILGVPTAADRLLQRAVARVLEAVFEADFLDCSYGFRPGRNPHHALQALRVQIVTKKVGQIFEADIRSYFTRINHQWLRKMVAHRIADPVILSLIGKWLNAGAMQDGVVIYTGEGTPQGGPISPVLSNLYLHFVLDLWFEKKIKPQCRGEAKLVRFADDCAPRRREGGFMN
jgi:RNA-directed DNA polymerase